MVQERRLRTARAIGVEAKALAHLILIASDLSLVIAWCDRAVDIPQPGSQEDQHLAGALWSAALVAYSRCFGTGRRTPLPEETGLSVNADVHRKYRSRRDRHVAHPVDPFEGASVDIILDTEPAPRAVVGVATLAARHIAGEPDEFRQLRDQANGVLAVVTERIEATKQKVMENARREPLDDLYRRPPSDQRLG